MAKKDEIKLDIVEEGSGINLAEVSGPDYGEQALAQYGTDEQGWMRTIRQRPATGGHIVTSETMIRNPDGSYALSQSSVYVPN